MATINVCDVCGSRQDVSAESYWVDRCMDAAGSMSDEHEYFDLCARCERKVMKRAFRKLVSLLAPQHSCRVSQITGPVMVEAVKELISNTDKR